MVILQNWTRLQDFCIPKVGPSPTFKRPLYIDGYLLFWSILNSPRTLQLPAYSTWAHPLLGAPPALTLEFTWVCATKCRSEDQGDDISLSLNQCPQDKVANSPALCPTSSGKVWDKYSELSPRCPTGETPMASSAHAPEHILLASSPALLTSPLYYCFM